MNLTALSDMQLLASLKKAVARERGDTANVVAHLAEVDGRQLYLKYPSPSLTAYCIEALGYSEHAAAHRVTAARLVKRFPIILGMLRRGELHLSGLRTVGPCLDAANHQARLREASGKTRQQLELLVAAWSPKPDVPSRIVPVKQAPAPELLLRMQQEAPRGESSVVSTPTEQLQPPPQPQRPAPLPKPLAPRRYRIEITVDEEVHEALMRSRDNLRHVIPDGDVAKIISRAVLDQDARVAARKFGKRKRPAKPRKSAPTPPRAEVPAPSVLELPLEHTPRGVSSAPPAPRPEPDVIIEDDIIMTRTPGRAMRREVAERDGYRCCYVGEDGRRCSATAFLEYDHVTAWSLNGPTTSDNLQLLCKGHNRVKQPRWVSPP